jgi:hypothetical protein
LIKIPESATACAKHLLCLEIYPTAQAAASFTPELKSSKQITIASKPPSDTTESAVTGECLTRARKRNKAAFL